ncbi:MAG: hypothetical protein FJ090_15820 [Deltaproteobacteria bacterium]|nr:hypothetical protein [Deltaproteobacteria bacterium]
MISFLFLACSNPETIPEGDILGKLVVPKAAATRTVVSATDADGDGNLEYSTAEKTDVRLLGPIYVGAYSAIDTISFAYPHPSMGPVISADSRGDTFPYGGITAGRLDFACYEAVACKVTTGRFTDYDDIIDHFKNNLGRPIFDQYGVEVTSGEAFQQWCFEYFDATADYEMSFIGADNLTFEEDGDNYVAEFTLNHTLRVEGMAVWGFMDAPELRSDVPDTNGNFTTCASNGGREVDEYVTEFHEGRSYYDVLNRPGSYITYGDWVSDGEAVVHFDDDLNQTEEVVVNLNIPFEAEE